MDWRTTGLREEHLPDLEPFFTPRSEPQEILGSLVTEPLDSDDQITRALALVGARHVMEIRDQRREEDAETGGEVFLGLFSGMWSYPRR